MCGINGIVNFQGNQRFSRENIESMNDALQHRGPDAGQAWSEGAALLGHRRLSILDLSSAADQPMHDSSGRYTIVFNGEIYNYIELREQLEKKGHRFRTNSDTEVLLEGFIEWGPELFNNLRGIFAFAVWDSSEKKLTLVRDQVGVKPLFYHQSSFFAFSSEIKGILSLEGFSRSLDAQALRGYFSHNYVAAPRTGFKDIQQLMPASFLEFTSSGVNIKKYWSPALKKREGSLNSFKEEFLERLDQTVKIQTRSDVPVCNFLSGGVDSTLVAYALKRAGSSSTQFSMGLKSKTFNEAEFAKETARQLDHPIQVVQEDFQFEKMPELISKHLEEPMADASAIACYPLYQAARNAGFKVALSGDGADEIFAGYETYQASLMSRRIPSFLRGSVKELGRLVSAKMPLSNARYPLRDKLERFTSHLNQPFPKIHAYWRTIFDESQADIFNGEFLSAQDSSYDEYHSVLEGFGQIDDLDQLLLMDFLFYLPNDMLVKVDRMSMANSLEVRVPFLDIDLVEFAFSLPREMKLNGKNKKHLLREIVGEGLSKESSSRKKMGFNIPLGEYFRGAWAQQLLELFEELGPKLDDFFNREELRKLVDCHLNRRVDAGYRLFSLLMFCLWLKNVENEWKCH